MLQIEDNQILENISLFQEKEQIPLSGLTGFLKSLRLNTCLPTPKQASYARSYSFSHLILIYFLTVENINQFMQSAFGSWIKNGKDVFYRTCANPFVQWRKVVYQINKKLIAESSSEQENKKPACLIIDDTDFEKRGRKIEFIGYVWSHVFNRSILGFKSLNLCYWFDNCLLALDFSMHIEQGNNKSKPQGMKKRHLKERYSKQRPDNSPGARRAKELSISKIESSIKMIKRALRNGIVARYVLMDSWFCCEQIIKFLAGLTGVDLICRAKMGRAKYVDKHKEYNAKQLLAKYKYRKGVRKYSRKLKTHYFQLRVTYKSTPVQLVFLQTGRNKWILFLSTHVKAKPLSLIETYQIRWTIEVFYKQSKQLLGLGKCQANDFDAQIAHASLSILRYNLLARIKTKSEHFGIGTLFRSINQSIPNPNIVDRIIKIFYRMLNMVSQLLEIDIELILEKIFSLQQLSDYDRKLLELICGWKTCET